MDVAGGWHDANKTVPIQASNNLFRMYSMTKPITSVAVLMLMEEGRLLLTDPVSKYIPAFADVKVQEGDQLVAPTRPITIRDPDPHVGHDRPGRAHRQPGARPTRCRHAHDRAGQPHRRVLPFRSQPGTRFDYGFGQDIAGVVVENISGQRLDTFLRTRIFEPLGMNDTSFYLPPEKANRLVPEFGPVPQGSSWTWTPLPPAIYSSDKLGQPQVHFGGGGWGGGVVSTVGDYFRFAQMLANGGQWTASHPVPQVGRADDDLPHRQPAHLAGPGYGFGLGVSVRTDLTSGPVIGSVGRLGWSGAGLTYFFVDPTERLVAIRFANVLGIESLSGVGDINPTFDTLVYQALT